MNEKNYNCQYDDETIMQENKFRQERAKEYRESVLELEKRLRVICAIDTIMEYVQEGKGSSMIFKSDEVKKDVCTDVRDDLERVNYKLMNMWSEIDDMIDCEVEF